METVQNKIQKTSKGICIVLRVIQALIVCGAILLMILGISLLLENKELLSFIQLEIDEMMVSEKISEFGIGLTQFLLAVVVIALIQALLVFCAVENLHRIFKDISVSYTPFEQKHTKRMRGIALILLLLGAVSLFANIYDSIFSYGEIIWQFDFIWLVLAGALYCFAFIFDYGCQLQQLTDETL